MIHRLTILKKGLILIAVPLVFQLGFIALVSKMRVDNARAVEWSIHTKDVIALAEGCRVHLLAAHGSIQGYIITGDPGFGASMERSGRQAREALRSLRALVSDNSDQSLAADRIGALASALLDSMTEKSDLVRSGRMTPELSRARRVESQRRLDALDVQFDSFIAEEKRLDVLRRGWLDRSLALIDTILIAGVIASLICTSVVAVLFARSISGRVAVLTDNSIRLAEGKGLAPPIGGGDEIARLDLVFHDMARTLAEASRRERSHTELIERRAEELDSVNKQLREKAREVEMFVYSVSHDLRSPLVNLQGFSKELGLLGKDLVALVDADGVPPEVRRRARTMIDTEVAESLGFIRSAVSRLSAIIDALLRLSRAGRIEYRRQDVEVGPIVERVVSALRGTIDERGATVSVGELPAASGDPTAIEQVFGNLVGNAVNYLDRARPGRIEVFAVGPEELAEPVPPGSVVFAVRDNGLGIADSYKGKVFTAFQRLHGDIAKGEGIGLALVRRVVERHGGKVWFESEAGRGSTFFVALPAVRADEDDADVAAGDPASEVPSTERDVAWQPSR